MSAIRPKYRHSACVWTVGDGSTRFTGVSRPSLSSADTIRKIKLIANGRTGVEGVELHYPNEISDRTAKAIKQAIKSEGLVTAMVTPNHHHHSVHRGLSSAHKSERDAAVRRSEKTIDLAYLMETEVVVFWQGGEKYDDYTSINLPDAIKYYAESVNRIIRYDETAHSGRVTLAAEAKPNEPGRFMLFQTDSDFLALRPLLERPDKFKLNPETGHSELAGLDPVQSLAMILAHDALGHYHINKQFGTKFDTDDQVDVDKTRLYLIKLLMDHGFAGWVGHDIQPRHNYNAKDAVGVIRESVENTKILERIVSSANWKKLDQLELSGEYLEAKKTVDRWLRSAK